MRYRSWFLRAPPLAACAVVACSSLVTAQEQLPLTVAEVSIDPTLRHLEMTFHNAGQTTITAWSVAVTVAVGSSTRPVGQFVFDSAADEALEPVTALAGGGEIRTKAALDSSWPMFTSASTVAVDAVLLVDGTALGSREGIEAILNSASRARHLWRELLRLLDVVESATSPVDALDHLRLDAIRSWPSYRVLARDQLVSLLGTGIDDVRGQRREVIEVIRQLRGIAEAQVRVPPPR